MASEFLARTEAKRAPILSFDRLIVNPGAFRLFLAGLVILSHFSAISTGRVGVALFFMLSGYWISSLWNRVGGYGHVLKFFGNRFFRIYPLYIAVVLICILLFPVRITPSTFLLLGVASTEGPRAIGVEWSLDLELEFYILFPILYFIITRYAVYSFAIFLALTAIGWGVFWGFHIENVLQFILVFCAGMSLYLMKGRISARTACISLASFILFFAVCCLIPAIRPQTIASGRPELIDPDIFAMIWACLLIPYVGASVKKRSNHIDRMLGDSSYPLYLIHWPIIRLAGEFVAVAGILTKSLIFACILLCAAALYLIVDRPMESLRRRFLD